MSGNIGLFSHKFQVYAYFENAGGVRVGAPVRLEGVDIGSVSAIKIVSPKDQPPPRVTTTAGELPSANEIVDKPVQITMKVGDRYIYDLRNDSVASLSTAGVLGETFVDIDSTGATGRVVQDGDVLRTRRMKSMEGMIASSQSTVENLDVLIRRVDRIVSSIEQGQGSVGKLLTDETLYNRLNSTLAEFQSVANQVSNG